MEKISTVQKNKEIKCSKINQYSSEMNELTQNAEKSIHLIFQLYSRFRDGIESLSTSELEQLQNGSRAVEKLES